MALIALKWSIKTKRSPRNRFSRRPGLKASTGRPPGGVEPIILFEQKRDRNVKYGFWGI